MPKNKYDTRTNRSPKPQGKPQTNKPPAATTKEAKSAMGDDLIFALDIGTRSVIGIVAEMQPDGEMKIIATERQEHKTRAMLDGQIHDVPQVAAVIKKVKEALEKIIGKKIKSAAVAAAGRALYTMTAEAELDIGGLISEAQERDLDFAGVQAAQAKLATSHTVDDPTRYYCVGYSTIKYELDGNRLKSLVGQRGKKAKATVIATFLPRQVIDSMQSALNETGLDMKALTLEPIAAINVLIPPTMRHLNLVLVDIGAGTSDVAITKNSSVIAYGMVPQAGDEITEAISQKFLLDFNVAERIKRKAADGEGATFADILGTSYDLSAEAIIQPVLPNIKNLADAIAKQVLELNGEAPQAVMLVGGGSLTPQLQQFVADALSMPLTRVAVRHPETVDGVQEIPRVLQSPDAVTPLGILKIASINTLHFLSVYVNNREYSLFNFRELTVSDALLNAGINLRKFNGHPGLGLMVTIDGERKSFPGTMGTLAQISLDGEPANLNTPVQNDSRLTIIPGKDGTVPKVLISEVVPKTADYIVYINGEETAIHQQFLVNGQNAEADYELKDGDAVETRDPKSLGEALKIAGFAPSGRRIHYTLNDKDSHYTCMPHILLNDLPATLSAPISPGDHIDYTANDTPKLGDVLNLTEKDASILIYYNKEEHRIPSASIELTLNGRHTTPHALIEDGCKIRYIRSERMATTVSDALLAVDFQPPAATSRLKFTLLVNGHPAEFTDPVKNGDSLDVILTPIDGKGGATTPPPNPATAPPSHTVTTERSERPRPRHPSISDFIRRD
ncbi:MAG: rod shape-determining protein [Selenomonadaceae bacterium]|nr:rod shape-determining protein [Selenomonadaceae bacterium]